MLQVRNCALLWGYWVMNILHTRSRACLRLCPGLLGKWRRREERLGRRAQTLEELHRRLGPGILLKSATVLQFTVNVPFRILWHKASLSPTTQ